MFEAALEAGLVAAGVDVQLMGPMPTPAVAHLTRSLRADGGIVISASHNPHYDNGIKFFSAEGEKLDDATELAIEAALDQPFTTVPSEQLGKAVRTRDALEPLRRGLQELACPRASTSRGMRIAMDCAQRRDLPARRRWCCANSARASMRSASIPNGLNINDGVGSTHPEALVAHVRATGADLGIAFDGDGDRVLFVDGDGAVLRRRRPAVRARDATGSDSGRLRGPVVGTLMTNYGAGAARSASAASASCAPRSATVTCTRCWSQHDGVLGGEASGHLLCLDRASTGDGIVSALQVLEVLRAPRHLAARGAGRHAQRCRRRPSTCASRAGAKPARAPRPCRPRWPTRRRRSPAAAARSCVRPAPNRSCASRSKPTTTR